MIRDKIENLANYVFINPNMNLVVDFLKDINNKENGRYDICDGVFINLMEFETKTQNDYIYEAHKKYIDIQCVIIGHEAMYYNTDNNLEISQAYNGEKDIMFYKPNNNVVYTEESKLSKGEFAVFFATEPHCPGCSYNGVNRVRKAVVKIRI